jgi:hypothetical protein
MRILAFEAEASHLLGDAQSERQSVVVVDLVVVETCRFVVDDWIGVEG